MSSYMNFILTDQGRNLLNDIISGEGELEFRCISIGSGNYTNEEKDSETIRNMVSLREERQRSSFSRIQRKGKNVELKAHITNQGVSEEYLMTELGIYAARKNSENEVLYCVSLREGSPDVMPDFSMGRIHDIIFKVQVSIGDASNVSIEYKSDTYALEEDFQSHINDKANPHGVSAGQIGALPADGKAVSAVDADKVGGYHIVVLSEAAYQALGTKDANTFYFRYKE